MTERSPAPAFFFRWLVSCLGVLALGAPALAQTPGHPDVTLSAVPAWVVPITPDEPARAPGDQVSQGVYYLLSDTQVMPQASGRTQYRHIATKALTQPGVESIAHVEIRFDPAYESLALHLLQVRRGGRVIDKLATAQVKVLQRERELDYLIFDGSKTANVILDDVRVGDVVEYAYSLKGSNPVFGNRLAGTFGLRGSVPLQHVYARLLWPLERPLEIRKRNGAPDPVVTRRGTMRELVWEARKVEPLRVEQDAPGWFDPYPEVQWSEFKDWQAVARWAEPFYRAPQPSAEIAREVARIAEANRGDAERMVAALQFVQREIRYMGVEIGPNSHAPAPPQQVLERRFGDCKDKSLLTMTLLRALGIEARAALVNTVLRRDIRDFQPSPFAFNHVLVRATLNGRHYWIDPTRSPQTGDLGHLYQPDYEAALIVDAGTQSLVPMSADTRPRYENKILARYDASGGEGQPVAYTVTSTYQGAAAESMRATLASENRHELQKRYLNYYARYHPELTVAEPMHVADDGAANQLTVTEHYAIPHFWKKSADGARLQAEIPVPEIDQYLAGPSQSIRSSPLALLHPSSLAQTTEVRLPGDGWKITPEDERITDPHFEFRRVRRQEGSLMTLVDRFDSKADHVAPADIARYAASLERARKTVDLVLQQGIGSAATSWVQRMNWPIAMLAVLLLALWSWLALKFYRHDPPPRATPPAGAPSGIGGWLLLPALGVVVVPIRLMADIAHLVPSYAADAWSAVTTAGSASFHPLWAPVLLFELAGNLAYMVISVLLLVMFFQKRRSVPALYICALVFGVAIHAIDLAITQGMPGVQTTPKEWGEIARAVMSALIWGSYFRLSKRVRNTFVHTRRREPPAFLPTRPEPAFASS